MTTAVAVIVFGVGWLVLGYLVAVIIGRVMARGDR